MTLLDEWLTLVPEQPDALTIGIDLIVRWSQPYRHYHTADHLVFMLSVVNEHAEEADDITAVRLAAWFHDAVYDPKRTDNEMASAELAATTLAKLGIAPEQVAEVVRLIWLTASHSVEGQHDRNGALLCDADLAILAVATDAYAAYMRAIRDEYAHVPDDAFRAGRIAVLTKLLDLPQLYRLPALVEAWEARARANVSAEISALRASGA